MNGIVGIKNVSGSKVKQKLQKIMGDDVRIEQLEFFVIHYPKGQKPQAIINEKPISAMTLLKGELPKHIPIGEKDTMFFIAETEDNKIPGGGEDL